MCDDDDCCCCFLLGFLPFDFFFKYTNSFHMNDIERSKLVIFIAHTHTKHAGTILKKKTSISLSLSDDTISHSFNHNDIS